MVSKASRSVEVLREEGPRALVSKGGNHCVSRGDAWLSAVIQRANRLRYGLSGKLTRIMDEDWDDLILLDACRYDQFERLNRITGDLESRISLGSATPEFLAENFRGERHHDTVYVTANPMYQTVDLDGTFHDVVDVWETDWDETRNTVQPSAMAEAALEAHESFPNKRLLVHFMQPHYPFIGETGRRIEHSGYERTYRKVTTGDASRDAPMVWQRLKRGELDLQTVRTAYDENLELVFPAVERLTSAFDGRTVITSDHGNFLGERITPIGGPMYGHPKHVYVDELRRVPWLVLEGNHRKRLESEPPQGSTDEVSSVVESRLAELGYTDR